MTIVYLSLGSNLDDRVDHLKKAAQFLGDSDEVEVIKSSHIYETEPWFEKSDQPLVTRNQTAFLNQVIAIKTSLPPFELLELTQQIERKLGRKTKGDLEPRTIDIDLLLYGDKTIETDHLKIPHPLIKARKFVLVPLLEVNSSLAEYQDALKICQDDTKIKPYESRKH